MTDQMKKLLAAASCASGASLDMIEAVRDGRIYPTDNIAGGDTLRQMADGLRLLIEAMQERPAHEEFDEDAGPLHAALIHFLTPEGEVGL